MKLLLKLLLAIVLAWMLDGLQPEGPPDLAALPAAVGMEVPAHGTFCLPAGGGAVFLGRDVPELVSYGAFARWCAARGGVTRWSA